MGSIALLATVVGPSSGVTARSLPDAVAALGRPATAVTDRTEIGDLGITRVRFANGVVLYVKCTPFEAGTVRVAARIGSGRIGMPTDKQGLDLLAGQAFVDGGRRITFEQWAAQADAVAGWMAREHGVGKGDIVAIKLPSSIDYAIAYQAALRLGAVASGVNPRLGPSEPAHILGRTRPKLVVDAAFDPEVLEVRPHHAQRTVANMAQIDGLKRLVLVELAELCQVGAQALGGRA